MNLRLWAMLALLVSLVSLAVGTSFAKSLFPALGAEGTTAYRIIFAMLMLMAVCLIISGRCDMLATSFCCALVMFANSRRVSTATCRWRSAVC